MAKNINFADRIKSSDKGITTYIDDLKAKKYQIPTFQRELVWDKTNIKKLWDSIYKFYPLGSILIWKTDIQLQNHREVGGHEITDNEEKIAEYQYILDGQQRTTSLLTSLYGSKQKINKNEEPTLYFNLTINNTTDTDDEIYKKRFLFWNDIDDNNGKIKRNVKNKENFENGLIIKLSDIKQKYHTILKTLLKNSFEFESNEIIQLERIYEVLNNYKVAFIELRGIEVGEVCQIFERINQAGKPLNIFDIVVAKTYRLENKEKNISQFYLREIIENFRTENSKNNPSKFLYLSDLDYLQILAVIIREYIPNSKIYNITDRYLNDIKAEQIELIWEKAQIAILKTFEFFDKFLYINDPKLIPYRYFYLSIATYFYNNETPDYDKLKKYFWYYSFHNDDLLKNTQNLKFHIAQLIENTDFDRFIIDKNKLRNATYSSKGRLSRAILSLYANQQPLDWKYTDKYVLSSKIFFSTDKPNLHHIFPTNSEYVKSNKNINYITSDSLMNIAYLTQDTNFAISNKNPLKYIKEFDENPNFEQVLNSHLLPKQILQWSRMDEMPANALDQFIEIRIEKIIENLENKLLNITFDTRDEKENLEN